MRRGDDLKMILIQVNRGTALVPTREDAARLRTVAKRHCACDGLLAARKKGRMRVLSVA